MPQLLQTPEFGKQYKKLDGSFKKQAKKLIQEIIQDPLRKSSVMEADYKGLRKRRKGSRIRVLYGYCKDCRERGASNYVGCGDCSDVDDDTIKFFAVGLRGQLYE